MTGRREGPPDGAAARRAARDSVRDAIGKLIGDDGASREAADAPPPKRPPQR